MYKDNTISSTFIGYHSLFSSSKTTPNQAENGMVFGVESTGKETDCETGFSYFGARYYDPTLLTSFLSIDRYADKYPSLSPYHYCAWNPVKLIDPSGDSIDFLIKKNSVNYKAMSFILKHKMGARIFGKFAKKGQTVAGHTFTKDGVWHKKGFNLTIKEKSFTGKPESADCGPDGDSKSIHIDIHPNGNFADHVLSLLHEVIQHADVFADDYCDDNKYNYSNLHEIADYASDINKQHYHEWATGSMLKYALPILRDIYTAETDSDIISNHIYISMGSPKGKIGAQWVEKAYQRHFEKPLKLTGSRWK